MTKPKQYSKPGFTKLAFTPRAYPYASKKVLYPDIRRVVADAYDMKDMCAHVPGLYYISHAHVTFHNPLAFFIDERGYIIANPKIHGEHGQIEQEETCVFHKDTVLPIKRPKSITVSYEYIEDVFTPVEYREETLTGARARAWLHVMEHIQGVTFKQAHMIGEQLHHTFPKNG